MCGDNHMSLHLRFNPVSSHSSPPSVQFSVTHHSNALSLSLSLSCPSLSINSSLHSQLHTKRSFPSQHLNKRIYATSHAYQICQLANGRAGEQREIHIKRPWFQPEIHSTSASSRRHIHKNNSSRHQESQQQSQERLASIKIKGQLVASRRAVSPQHIKTDSQFRIRRSKLSATTRTSNLSLTVQEGVNVIV